MIIRLSLLLGAAMSSALLIAGEDESRLRPALARAHAEGTEIIPIVPRRAEPLSAAHGLAAALSEPQADPATTLAPAPALRSAAVAEDFPPPLAGNGATAAPAPVFTLSALPNASPDHAEQIEPASLTVAADDSASGLRFISARSVNVREAPTTRSAVLERLHQGEAVTVLSGLGSDWVEIAIEGDGVQGFVAARFLSEQP